MRFVSYYSRAISDASGVTAALWSWARSLQRAGHEVLVLHAGGVRRSPTPTDDGDPVDKAVVHLGRGRSTYLPIGLLGTIRPGDTLILHEGWVLSNLAAVIAARLRRVPYVVVPHGVYEPGILASLRGPLFLRRLLERWVLEGARGVHVFWPSERSIVHAVAPRARVFVAPTGFELSDDRWVGGGGYVAWLGRFDPVHKGLDTLLDALSLIDPLQRPALRLHGMDYNGGLTVVRDHVRRLGLEQWVTLGGPIYGAEKDAFLRSAEAYVHPSRWESHSIALLECLALGLPSVVSGSIHIAPALSAHCAALVVQPTPDGLAEGLKTVHSDVRMELADSARAFIRTQLDWDSAVAAFVDAVDGNRPRST